MYSQAFSRDSGTIKTLVYSIYAVMVCQTIMYTNDGFNLFAVDPYQSGKEPGIGTFWFSVCIVNGIGGCLSQNTILNAIYKHNI